MTAAVIVCAATALGTALLALVSWRATSLVYRDLRNQRLHYEARIDAMLSRQDAFAAAIPLPAPPGIPAPRAGAGPPPGTISEELELRLNEEVRRVEEMRGQDSYGDPLPV